jgi:hypothetical protein
LAVGTVLLGCAVTPIGYAAVTFHQQDEGASDGDDGGKATTANPIHEAAETE